MTSEIIEIEDNSEAREACWVEWTDTRFHEHDDLQLNKEEALRFARQIIEQTHPHPSQMPQIRIETKRIIKFRLRK